METSFAHENGFSLRVIEDGHEQPHQQQQDGENQPSSSPESEKFEAGKESGEAAKTKWMNLVLFSVLLLLVALQIAFALSQYIFTNDMDLMMASGSLVVSMIIGIIALGVLFEQFLEGKVEAMQHQIVLHEKPLNALLRNSLSLVGLLLFCPFACLLEMFQVFIAISCQKISQLDHDDNVGPYYRLDAAFHVLHVIFMAMELVFCLQFRKIDFVPNENNLRRFCVRLSLVVVVAVNLGTWFSIIIYETSESFKRNGDHQNGTQDEPENGHCSKSVFGNIDETIRHVLYPFTVEFCLLGIEYVTGHFIFKEDSESKTEEEDYSSLESPTESGDSIKHIATASSLDLIADDQCNSDEEENNSPKRRRQWRFEPLVIVIFGVFPNLVCITVVFFANEGSVSESFFDEAILISLQYMSCHWVIMICLVIVGIICAYWGKFDVDIRLKGFDYLVMVSVFGPFLGRVLRVIVISEHFEMISQTIDPYVALFPEALNLMQLLLQLPFVFYADSIEYSPEKRKEPTWRLFKAIILSLAFWNITLWLIDSVLLRVDVLETIFDGTSWMFLDGIFRPLTIFYRFNSCLILLRAYLR